MSSIVNTAEALVDSIADGASTPLSPAERTAKQAELVSAFPFLGDLARAADQQFAQVQQDLTANAA